MPDADLADVSATRMRWEAPLSEEHAALLLQRLDIQPGASVLDLGCGWGELLGLSQRVSFAEPAVHSHRPRDGDERWPAGCLPEHRIDAQLLLRLPQRGYGRGAIAVQHVGVDEERGAYLDSVLIGGREPVTVTVVDYDNQWPARFEVKADEIRRALGQRARSLEHIGSTSVPDLAAKPIIDMLLTVDDVEDERVYVPPLEPVGFVLRVREPGHRMLRTPQREVHLHVYEPDRAEVRDYLDLRDWLRVDDEDRGLYAATKRRLAQQQWCDMNAYADAKTDVLLQILARARAWRADRSSAD